MNLPPNVSIPQVLKSTLLHINQCLWTCGPVNLRTCGPDDLWTEDIHLYEVVWTCGPVDLWTCGPVDLWT